MQCIRTVSSGWSDPAGFNRVAARVAAGLLMFASLAGAPASARAQNLTASSIEGTVTDQTAARLPGVTVTATSPALQVPQLVTTSDAEGRYRFVDLPPGLYQVKFELQGFVGLVRDSLTLTAGFALRVDASLQLGQAEVVTVTGETPVVDTTTTSGGQTISTAMIVTVLPGSKTVADLVTLTPGLTNTDGGSPGQFARPRFNMYGIDSGNTNITMMLDGFQILANNPVPDVGATQETDVRTFGNGAEVKEVGVLMNLVLKAGGNSVHGEVGEIYMSAPSQNIDDALRARGVTVSETLKYFNDIGFDAGGPVRRERLWFFGGVRDRRNQTTVPGLPAEAGPDGVYFTADDPAASPKRGAYNLTGKLTWQISPRYQALTLWTKDQQTNEAAAPNQGVFGVTTARIPLEGRADFYWRPFIRKGELKGQPSGNLLFDVQFGESGYENYFGIQPQAINLPTSYDRATNILTGSNTPRSGTFLMWILDANAVYAPEWKLAGRHELKFGYHLSRRNVSSQAINKPAGNYALLFDTLNGVAHQASQLETNNSPVDPVNWDNVYSAYGTDQWRIGDRLTLNLGLRWDYQHSFVPAQNRGDGQFVPAASFAEVDVLSYSHIAPRAAIAWDITGSGRTVLKTSYGWFNTEDALAGNFNRNAYYTTVYRWRDLNRNNNYDPGESNLDPNGPDFVSTTNAANNRLNPNLKLANVQELALTFEQQIGRLFSARGLYLYRQLGNQYASVNVLRPYSAYNIPIVRVDPGPDGVQGNADDGGNVTVTDYDPAYRGANFVGNMSVNRPDGRNDSYQSIEGALSMRFSEKWSMQGSYSATKYRRYLVGVPQSPNDEYFPLDESWRWGLKFAGNYTLPYDVTTGVVVSVNNGLLGQRTYVFRSIPQLSTVNLPMEKFGSRQEAAQVQVDLRVGKRIRLSASRRLELSIDLLNATNSNAITAASYASGPAFGTVSAILPPRQVRWSARYSF